MERVLTDWQTRSICCNLCGEDRISELWVKDGFRYVQCRECGLVYVNPQLFQEEIERIYEIGFQSKSESKPAPTDFLSYQPVLQWAAPYRQNGRFLDVGCFKGHLLLAAQNQGWNVFGTEISEQAVENARNEQGLEVFLGALPEASYPDQHFDVVIMQDVIEHLDDPLGYLREIQRILRPGGGLYMDTPNFGSLTRFFLGKEWSIFFPWHQFYFTAGTLNDMIQKAGLKTQKIECINLSPVSRYNAFRSMEQRQEIARSSRLSIKFWLRHKVPFLKKLYLFSKLCGNIPMRILSILGVHIGSKIILTASKVRPE